MVCSGTASGRASDSHRGTTTRDAEQGGSGEEGGAGNQHGRTAEGALATAKHRSCIFSHLGAARKVRAGMVMLLSPQKGPSSISLDARRPTIARCARPTARANPVPCLDLPPKSIPPPTPLAFVRSLSLTLSLSLSPRPSPIFSSQSPAPSRLSRSSPPATLHHLPWCSLRVLAQFCLWSGWLLQLQSQALAPLTPALPRTRSLANSMAGRTPHS